jgi:hypothetical protein
MVRHQHPPELHRLIATRYAPIKRGIPGVGPIAMAWAWVLALVVVVGVGLPVAGWLITRRAPPPRTAGRLGAGSDTIDRWLLDQYQLPPRGRSRVRKAVFQGQQVSEAALAHAAAGLAARVLAGGFTVQQVTKVVGWANLVLTICYAGLGIFLLTDGRALGILALVGSGLYLFVGVERALRAPRRIRRNAARALQLNQDDT